MKIQIVLKNTLSETVYALHGDFDEVANATHVEFEGKQYIYKPQAQFCVNKAVFIECPTIVMIYAKRVS